MKVWKKVFFLQWTSCIQRRIELIRRNSQNSLTLIHNNRRLNKINSLLKIKNTIKKWGCYRKYRAMIRIFKEFEQSCLYVIFCQSKYFEGSAQQFSKRILQYKLIDVKVQYFFKQGCIVFMQNVQCVGLQSQKIFKDFRINNNSNELCMIFSLYLKKNSVCRMSVASNSQHDGELKETPIETKFTWTMKSIEKLKELHVLQQGNWKSISSLLNGPTPLECMIKWQQLHPDQSTSRQLWSPEEDEQLQELVQKFGKKWSKICTVMNWRTGKQVRERYLNQLQGTINQEKWTEEEDKLILKLYKKFGTKWSYISSFLNGRPENMVKNRFYSNLKRRYQCDLGDSDDEDLQEESLNSFEEDQSRLQKRRRPQKNTKEPQKIKKVQVAEDNIENFQRMTRSKNQKQNEDSSKQYGLNEDQNNENNSGLQNIASTPSYCTPQANQINIKEENQLKCDHFNYNSSNVQQSIPAINMFPQTVSPFHVQQLIHSILSEFVSISIKYDANLTRQIGNIVSQIDIV
ncbi:unnamed protein product (macronuclear) [Paramecium tetraurelia]|uniref:Uncharacterized protein n=1 Tax=Paramecium tetraurelia TaxID=5888 RepID=A0CR05_PARTE|nr:uncharacterized protein GSPATT00038879001 [Paramecium tetraurelia]CAK73222.1 unnamed protein product [Paramecium tetraurelia]|eukprot:XP_001440619.1 hypothetical protein (macronuclear) [Paramecium tetraurelia strain d4-2]